MNKIKKLAKRSSGLIIIYHILDNYLAGIRFKLGNIKTRLGSTHLRFQDVKDSIKYINKVFEEYFSYSGLLVEGIRGKRVLEVGPGDNFGVALKFLVNGANQVVCLDKFYSRRDLSQQGRIYEAMRDELTSEERRVFDEVVRFEDGKFRIVGERVKYVYGYGIEDAGDIFPEGSFDMIVSRAVLEHIYDIDGAFLAMDRLLKSGGYMIHNIDFWDHGIFTPEMHPLTFLTISDRVWRHMSCNSGKPNRKLINYYKNKMAELGYEWKILVNRVVGSDNEINPRVLPIPQSEFDSTLSLIKGIRARLKPGLKEMADEELIVASAFLIAKKRG